MKDSPFELEKLPKPAIGKQTFDFNSFTRPAINISDFQLDGSSNSAFVSPTVLKEYFSNSSLKASVKSSESSFNRPPFQFRSA
jgi:hypothetical protein